MKKLLALIAFSVLLLVPVGAQQVFADHPDLPCPPPGILNIKVMITSANLNTFNFCYHLPTDFGCVAPYSMDTLTNLDSSVGFENFDACTIVPQQTPDTTLEAQCQGAAVLISNHCFAEIMAMVGGILLSIDTTAVLVAAIGTDPVITGLVAITMAGVVGQTAWFIHRRKKKVLNS